MSDLISRQAVLESLNYSLIMLDSDGNLTFMGKRITEAIKRVPSVDPERKTGKWIEHRWAEEENGLLIPNWECNLCKMWERKKSDFCPNCGAEMEGADG